jgi:Leucine-rich repeat (LRR) protein
LKIIDWQCQNIFFIRMIVFIIFALSCIYGYTTPSATFKDNPQKQTVTINKLLSHPEQVYKLTLLASDVRTLGSKVGEFTNLTQLTIYADCQDSEKDITALAPEIANCQKLTVLNLGSAFDEDGRQDCSLNIRLPENITQLTSLKILSIDDALAKDQELPDLKTLQQLERLRISRYHHSPFIIPRWVSYLKKLHDINLDYNQIRFIPPDFGQLEQLETLSLLENQVHSLPETMSKLSHLKRIALGNNNLTIIEQKKLRKIFAGNILDFSNLWDDEAANAE